MARCFVYGGIASLLVLLAISGRGEGRKGLPWKSKLRKWRKVKREMGVSEFHHAADARQRVVEAVASFQSTSSSSEDAVTNSLSQG